jgi:hypothetical protein
MQAGVGLRPAKPKTELRTLGFDLGHLHLQADNAGRIQGCANAAVVWWAIAQGLG